MITPSFHVESLDIAALHKTEYDFSALSLPANIVLANGDLLSLEQVVRFVPKRRLVAFGDWQGNAIVAKIFFNPRRAKRQSEKEVAGVTLLTSAKIPTPALYYQGTNADQTMQILIFERILKAHPLETIWQEKKEVTSILPILRAMCVELATQHVLGIVHRDLHLKNFLVAKKRIYTLDGADIESHPYLLPKAQSLENLALFISQFGMIEKNTQEKLFRFYAKARGWNVKPDDLHTLFFHIKQWDKKRWHDYERKIFRSSSQFLCKKSGRHFAMLNRAYAKPALLDFLNHPENAFTHPQAILLKAGRSATVIKIMLDHHLYVIKRYNLKNSWHYLRRTLRVTRAALSWRLSQKLCLFGISTAKPVAFIEEKFFGFNGKSYFVMEYIEATQAGDFFKIQTEDKRISTMVQRITLLLKSLLAIGLTQGDLKITNILINQQEQPVLIDLDGAIEHASVVSLRHAWRKEWRRFMANFHDQPHLREQFAEAFKEKA